MVERPKVLFWYEEETPGFLYDWYNRVCNYHEAEILVVDTIGHFRGAHAFPTLEAVLEAHEGYELVWMDKKGDAALDEFQHPEGDVLYLIGHSIHGFGGAELIGHIVKLRVDGDLPALMVAYHLLYDRELYLRGRRL